MWPLILACVFLTVLEWEDAYTLVQSLTSASKPPVSGSAGPWLKAINLFFWPIIAAIAYQFGGGGGDGIPNAVTTVAGATVAAIGVSRLAVALVGSRNGPRNGNFVTLRIGVGACELAGGLYFLGVSRVFPSWPDQVLGAFLALLFPVIRPIFIPLPRANNVPPTFQDLGEDSPFSIAVNEASRRMGFTPRKCVVSSTPISGAWVFESGLVVLSQGLLEHLSSQEIAAVVAHELQHLKMRSHDTVRGPNVYPWLAGWLTTVGVYQIWQGDIPNHATIYLFAGSCGLAVCNLVAIWTASIIRKQEYRCDLAAKEVGYAQKLATGLEKLHELNGLPRHWPALNGLWAQHPSLESRLSRLG